MTVPCSTFARDELLAMQDSYFPSPLKQIIQRYRNETILTGVYDCHHSDSDNEVGMAAVCEPNGTCTCTALYCVDRVSCALSCNTNAALTIDSYTADCSNVKNGLTEECKVDCGFQTTGCFSNASTEQSCEQSRNLDCDIVMAFFRRGC